MVGLHPGFSQEGGSGGGRESKGPPTLLAAKASTALISAFLSGQVCSAAGSGEGPGPLTEQDHPGPPGIPPEAPQSPSWESPRNSLSVFHAGRLSLALAPPATSFERTQSGGSGSYRGPGPGHPTPYSDEEPGKLSHTAKSGLCNMQWKWRWTGPPFRVLESPGAREGLGRGTGGQGDAQLPSSRRGQGSGEQAGCTHVREPHATTSPPARSTHPRLPRQNKKSYSASPALSPQTRSGGGGG